MQLQGTVILKYWTNKWYITKEEWSEEDAYLLKIYGGKNKSRDFLVISLNKIHFGLTRQYNDNAHEAWMALFENIKFLNKKVWMKLQTGVTHAGSRTQAKILTCGSINYII